MNEEYLLTLFSICGILGIGVSGFSAIVVTLGLSLGIRWSKVDVIRLNVLLASSGVAVFCSLLPMYLLNLGLSATQTWTWVSAVFFALGASLVIFRMANRRSAPESMDVPRSIAVAGLLSMIVIVLSGINALIWQQQWVPMLVVFWQVSLSFYFFTFLLTSMAVQGEQSAQRNPTYL